VAAHQENGAKHHLKAQTGWSFETDHPGRALLTFDGASTPKLTLHSNSFTPSYELPLRIPKGQSRQ
jgi:hypothetical protein